jgi:transposase
VAAPNRKAPIPDDTTLYRRRHKIENMLGRLKDWRRIHTRYDPCAHTFMSAISLAAVIIFWMS